MSERKIVKDNYAAGGGAYGLGTVIGKFEAERFPGSPLLDTRVELDITPFSVTWNDRQRLIEEIAAVIARFQI